MVTRRPRSRVFLAFAMVSVAAALVGFFTTYTRPMWRGDFHGPALAHVHGAFLFAWILLFLAQAWLVLAGRTPWHRRLGWAGALIAPGAAFSTIGMGVYALRRDLAAGGGEAAYSSLVGNFTAPLMFLALFAAGVAWRKRPDVHRRLMLLATFAILWPAFFRFRHYFPAVPQPEIWFGLVLPQALVALAMLHDRLVQGALHRVYAVAGTLLMAENVAEAWLFDGAGWRAVGHALAAPFVP